MDEKLQSRAEQLAEEFAEFSDDDSAELNELMRLMMKSGLERMLDTEMDVHLGRKARRQIRTVSRPLTQMLFRKRKRRQGQPPQRPRSKDGARRIGRSDSGHAPRSQRHIRAADYRQAPAPHPRFRREDSGPLRQRDDHPRHSGDRSGPCTGWRSLRSWSRRSLLTWTAK